MQKILGLDLGTNSIGWALIEKNGQDGRIIDMGSRIFPAGVENLGDGEKEMSRNATRRIARQTRRQIFRRKLRKRQLLQELAKVGMCPLSIDEVKTFRASDPLPEINELNTWFHSNPYVLRSKALNERIELEELGRVLYHFSQRRGFQTNSRVVSEEGKIFEGKPKEGKTGIDSTRNEIGSQTLGSYLGSIYPIENKTYQSGQPRIRNRYTTRSMYISEFDLIWKKQSEYHMELTEDLKEVLGGRKKDGHSKDGILFYQRPLRSQKFLIGKCTFESNKTRCPISAIEFELFRAHQFINSIECNGSKLEPEERLLALEELLSKEKLKFSAIRKKIRKQGADLKFNYADDDSCPGSYTINHLQSKKLFGDVWWRLSDKDREDIWHIIFFFEDHEKLKDYAKRVWDFSDEQSERVAKLRLKQGYANLSRKAIRNILPFLELGYTYDIAVALGGVKNAFGERWSQLSYDQRDSLMKKVVSIVRSNMTGGFIEELRDHLRNKYVLSEKQLTKLYHHSTNIHQGELLDKLPVGPEADREIQKVRNPVVIQALFELRKVVNKIIERHGKPDQIKIELARDLKVSKDRRFQTRMEQRRLETMNEHVKKELTRLNKPHSYDNILKYKLWEECDHTCPFSGKSISRPQLFDDTGEVQIEHIIPWNRSLDDSFANKTLCFADVNRKKGNRTPYTYFTQDFGPEKWEEVKERILKTFYDVRQLPNKYFPKRYQKYKRFISTKLNEDFVSRQLNDTRYISREASSYLGRLSNNITVAPGFSTSLLRHMWGLNSVLSLTGEKTREDHRHHAIDALVMACTERKFVQELARLNQLDDPGAKAEFPDPWKTFRRDAEEKAGQILVSHKRNKKVMTIRKTYTEKNGKKFINKGVSARGQLHLESVYGKPQNGSGAYHIRKPLESITTKTHVSKIVDSRIRKLVEERIFEMGGYEGSKNDKVPAGSFFSYDGENNRIPMIKLPNSNGDDVPVMKVRIKENLGNAEQLHDGINRYVNPRNNHHILIYERADGTIDEECVQFWTATERAARNESVVRLPKDAKRLVAKLSENEMYLIDLNGARSDWDQLPKEMLCNYLYRVQKISSKDYNFRLHTAAGILNGLELIRIKSLGNWQKLNPLWVKVDETGNIIWEE